MAIREGLPEPVTVPPSAKGPAAFIAFADNARIQRVILPQHDPDGYAIFHAILEACNRNGYEVYIHDGCIVVKPKGRKT